MGQLKVRLPVAENCFGGQGRHQVELRPSGFITEIPLKSLFEPKAGKEHIFKTNTKFLFPGFLNSAKSLRG